MITPWVLLPLLPVAVLAGVVLERLLRGPQPQSVRSTFVHAADIRAFAQMLDEKGVEDAVPVPLSALVWELPG